MTDCAQELLSEPKVRKIFYLPRPQYAEDQPAVWMDDWRRMKAYAESMRTFALKEKARADEAYERAAKVCEEISDRKFGQQHAAPGSFTTANECAVAIRALTTPQPAGDGS